VEVHLIDLNIILVQVDPQEGIVGSMKLFHQLESSYLLLLLIEDSYEIVLNCLNLYSQVVSYLFGYVIQLVHSAIEAPQVHGLA
jgi:hypothetical protein